VVILCIHALFDHGVGCHSTSLSRRWLRLLRFLIAQSREMVTHQFAKMGEKLQHFRIARVLAHGGGGIT
jgi:hypothetical protein